ncbi:MAG: hypothetical protein WDA09_04975 [Bacteriovoracaceae bacterium]
MKYLILLSLVTLTLNLWAKSDCEALYEAEVAEIAQKSDRPTRVGDKVYVNPYSGGLGYSPGVEMTSYGPNWAREFLGAINDGPELTSFSITKGKKKEFLNDLRKELSSVCKLKADPEHKNLRAFLKQQLDQQNFCPEGKILKPTMFGSYKRFHKIVKNALADSDDMSLCDNKVVQDDSHRKVKDTPQESSKRSHQQRNRAQQN